MSGYLQDYGAGEDRRGRFIKRLVIALVALLIVGFLAYEFFQNYSEERLVKQFISQINASQYPEAYQTWGCSDVHPCRDYSYQRFLEDWGPAKKLTGWKVSDVDGCPTGAIVTVAATGSEKTPLWVERGTSSLTFSPWPECQGKRWRFKQFFKNLVGR